MRALLRGFSAGRPTVRHGPSSLTPVAPLAPRALGPADAAPRRGRPLPLPRTWSIGAYEIVGILVGNGLLIAAMWIRHGGLDQLATLGGQLTAIGQVTALFGTYLALIQLVLMSRSPWLDQVFGMDGLAAAHRWLGSPPCGCSSDTRSSRRPAMRWAMARTSSPSCGPSSRPTRTC